MPNIPSSPSTTLVIGKVPRNPKRTSNSSLLIESLDVTYDAKMAYSTCEFEVPLKVGDMVIERFGLSGRH